MPTSESRRSVSVEQIGHGLNQKPGANRIEIRVGDYEHEREDPDLDLTHDEARIVWQFLDAIFNSKGHNER